jgi:crossover junction endodeoxyribonuclease RuvC
MKISKEQTVVPAPNQKTGFPDGKPVIIMGVDPGTVVMGFSIIACHRNSIELLLMDNLKMSWTHDVYERLQRIYHTMDDTIGQFRPDHFAIEAPFFGKNVQSMLKLGRAQGVAIACAMKHNLEVTEYSPKKVKQSITGNGNADKDQVWAMLQRIMTLTGKPVSFDASDALAVAVCHHYQMGSPLAALGNKAKGWESFIKNNPGRVK